MPGFDERIVSLYARGMSTREIAAHLQEMFGADVSPALISAITDTVADEVRAKCGFVKVAHFPQMGRTFEHWVDGGGWQVTLA